jgi:muconolactone delta-isomerase
MEFLVEFEVTIPDGTPPQEVVKRQSAEAAAAAVLARDGHLVRLWKPTADGRSPDAVGLYRAASITALETLLADLPLGDWLAARITPLASHPNDPWAAVAGMPSPRLTFVYRLTATLGPPLDLGEVAGQRRRIVPLTGGDFSGPLMSGTLVPGVSADWQTVLADGTALGDIRYTLQTGDGALLDVRSHSVRHGPADVLARLARGDDVDPGEYTFRTSTRVETGAPALAWMNRGIFVSVGGRRPAGVVYDTYLVG